MIPLPQLSKAPRGSDPLNPYNGRWRQWYVDIADWMISHPGGTLTDCAKDLGRSLTTISFITRSDIFRDYYAQRRAQHAALTDEMMRAKLTGVASKSLDVILEKLEKQGDKIPLKLVAEVATGALDRLGYAPTTPASGVNVNIDQRSVSVSVSADALTEARDAMRAAEEKRAVEHRMSGNVLASPAVGGSRVVGRGAEPGPDVLDLVAEAENAGDSVSD